VLTKAKAIASDIVSIEEDRLTQYRDLHYKHEDQMREQALKRLTLKAQKEQQQWLAHLSELHHKIQTFEGEGAGGAALSLAMQIFQTEEKIDLSQLAIAITQLQDRLEELSVVAGHDWTIAELSVATRHGDTISAELKHMLKTLETKFELLKQHEDIVKHGRAQKIISPESAKGNMLLLDNVGKQYQMYQRQIQALQKTVVAYQEVIQKEIKHAISRRQGLPGFSVESWRLLVSELVHIPQATLHVVKSIRTHVSMSLEQISLVGWVTLLFAETMLLVLWGIGRKVLRLLIEAVEEKRERVSANFVFVIAQLLRRNLGGLVIYAALLTLFFITELPFKVYSIVVYLGLVWFTFKGIIGLARLTLLETIGDATGRDVTLYYRLRRVFIWGGIITALTVLTHYLHVAYVVRDLFNRLLLLFLFVISLVMLRGWEVIPSLLDSYIRETRPYLRRSIHIFFFLLPIAFLINAVVGLVGYIDLAWTMTYYEMIFLLVLSGYVILRGLLDDFIDVLASLTIQHLKNGWLWSEVLLKPLDTMLRIVLVLLAFVVLFLFYGMDSHSVLLQKLDWLMHYELIKFGRGDVTLIGLIGFTITASITYWATRWSREISYRTIFSNVKDPGVRNSLTIFSQYAVVTIGSLIALRFLHIDFTGLTVILGAFAVGIGFGLRDLANNFVSGFLLLIERPVRAGDIVNIDSYEGEVTRIGMRSITVKTWDNTEVIVPNADIFSQAFTNWTHQDNIVRTVLSIKLHRHDDPHYVKTLIEEALNEVPAVQSEPKPEVLMTQIDEALIGFNIRYFISIAEHNRFVTRSRVLFNIWDKFKACGIRAPYPQQEIYLEQKADA